MLQPLAIELFWRGLPDRPTLCSLVNFRTQIWGFDVSNGNSQNNQGKSAQNPSNASFVYNGLSLSRSTNVLTDVISGVTLSLNGTHTGGASTSVNVTADRDTLKGKLQSLVATYNDVQFALDELSDPESEEEEVGGSLARDL